MSKVENKIELSNSSKVDVLLHYDSALRSDWQFLSKSRLLVASVFIGIQTSLIGWVVSRKIADKELYSDNIILIASSIISIVAVIIIAWFGSSINKTKLFIVKIESALLLFEHGSYTDEPILDSGYSQWGERKWWYVGKSTVASIILGISFIVILAILIY